MGRTFRPKFRWAAKYLKERYGPDGAKLASSITEPAYNTFGLLLSPPFEKDQYFLDNEQNFVTGGPYLWISRLLHERGPLTRKEMWALYQRDQGIDREDVPIRSLTQLKRDFLERMKDENMILNAGYSHIERRNLGYVVNSKVAFEKVHPSILFSMRPIPDCHLTRLYRDKVANLSSEDFETEKSSQTEKVN